LDIGVWLRGLGLERYAAAFRDNEIDRAALPKLTAQDLNDLGVVLASHRRKLLEAITALHGKPDAALEQVSAAPAAERRQLTVMFCDLVGSTALSASLDPEDLRQVIGAYHHAVGKTVAGFEGFVAKYMGDGVLIYFGYPRAHEDDAERAVRVGLGLIDAIGRLDVRAAHLQARVGQVVVGDLIGEGRRRNTRSSAKPPTSPPGCRPWPSRTRSSSPPAPAGSSAISSSSAISAPSRSRARRTGAGLAGAARERRREPVRGIARIGADPADWPGRGD
jgi:hypothetical protein